MSQQSRVGAHATKIHTHGGNTYIKYHNTEVVVFGDSWVMLDNGGWKTATTKLRMNQASNQFDLGYHVYQKDYAWYVVTPAGETCRFNERGTFSFYRKEA